MITVFGVRQDGPKRGPTHLMQAGFYGLSWCGAKAQYRHWLRPGTVDEVTCPRCLRQMRRDQPLAWRSRG